MYDKETTGGNKVSRFNTVRIEGQDNYIAVGFEGGGKYG